MVRLGVIGGGDFTDRRMLQRTSPQLRSTRSSLETLTQNLSQELPMKRSRVTSQKSSSSLWENSLYPSCRRRSSRKAILETSGYS